MKTLKVHIKEAKCQGCLDKVLKAVKKVKGVKSATSDLDSKVVNLEFDSSKTTEQVVLDSISKINYTPLVV